ncbi:tigger transposable element-derived protein 6-like [Acyrthosiphon pisum]|uniref:HTH CENPB-type domain-containing protein n=1 Tax=Acyrthosiphon pisum TaxID=7029 RepID=A0A8R2FC25_ACYPI|nr:tigger transposable element-derived protein 6-like [Acyrthosiphon pisum]|eukprot:XP_008188284.1 PREDICTED: tigger transposable element-derived protein 6-like [Acyrthosiphon pisum]
MAGKDWVKGFRKRHPEITLRSPEATSSARAQAFNRPNVMTFFTILQNVQQINNFLPHRVFNVDETGLTTVQSKCSNILALKGRRQVGSLTSAVRGVLSTIVVCMSAGENFIPPMIIFPRVRMKPELQDGAPPETIFHCHPSGWMQLEIFTEWFQHFINHAKPTAEDPVLLILDGHMTHTRNLQFIDLARINHTTVVCLPPHCSHELQPLDVSFMGPLNTYYVQAIEKFL